MPYRPARFVGPSSGKRAVISASALAVSLLLVVEAAAQTRSPRIARPVRPDPLLGYSQRDPSVVSVGGAYVGRDPDPNIRAQLNRFPGSYVSGGF
ncbi:MAG: hypothetical protein JO289_16765 [Xanthobacteraceae bacterium]|nr:hypothetical protein [Xanthobacteraceae bacterium]